LKPSFRALHDVIPMRAGERRLVRDEPLLYDLTRIPAARPVKRHLHTRETLRWIKGTAIRASLCVHAAMKVLSQAVRELHQESYGRNRLRVGGCIG
jgi:hypothetical protein